MVHSHVASLVPLLDQLQEYGKFSKKIPVESSDVKEISDYIFSELITGIKTNRFPHSGNLFDIKSNGSHSISIATFLTFNCQHVKCFSVNQSDFDSICEYFDQVSRVYTHLFFERQRFVFHEITVMYREVSG